MKIFLGIIGGILALFALVVLANLLGFVDLAFLGYRTNLETHITRQTNAYLTAHQTALRTMKANYDALPDDAEAQRKGIARQMHEEADLIPNDVQPDIAAFLTSH
jgi:Tfp pilus assembly protein PilN